jgi:hypothetical protein
MVATPAIIARVSRRLIFIPYTLTAHGLRPSSFRTARFHPAGPTPPRAPRPGDGGERFPIVTPSGARDQDGNVHSAQQRNVIGAVTQPDGADGPAPEASKPRLQFPHGGSFVIPPENVEEATAARSAQPLVANRPAQSRPGGSSLLAQDEGLVEFALHRKPGFAEAQTCQPGHFPRLHLRKRTNLRTRLSRRAT